MLVDLCILITVIGKSYDWWSFRDVGYRFLFNSVCFLVPPLGWRRKFRIIRTSLDSYASREHLSVCVCVRACMYVCICMHACVCVCV